MDTSSNLTAAVLQHWCIVFQPCMGLSTYYNASSGFLSLRPIAIQSARILLNKFYSAGKDSEGEGKRKDSCTKEARQGSNAC